MGDTKRYGGDVVRWLSYPHRLRWTLSGSSNCPLDSESYRTTTCITPSRHRDISPIFFWRLLPLIFSVYHSFSTLTILTHSYFKLMLNTDSETRSHTCRSSPPWPSYWTWTYYSSCRWHPFRLQQINLTSHTSRPSPSLSVFSISPPSCSLSPPPFMGEYWNMPGVGSPRRSLISPMSPSQHYPIQPRVLQHRKKRPGVDFFTKANSAGLTDLLIRNASIYSNITSSSLMLTSPGCLLYVEVVTHTILVDSSSWILAWVSMF